MGEPGRRAAQGPERRRTSPRSRPTLWTKGLAEWGQDGERIARLRAAADFAIYTPGSEAGLPVSILRSLAAPRARGGGRRASCSASAITTTVTSLLGLLGIDADPVQSREHILLSTLLDAAWQHGPRPGPRRR